jgi:uncharacterized protein YbjT (DUF2867 family)
MRIAVVGGTGLVGRHAVETAGRRGHEVVVVARSHGVDLVEGKGLDGALESADAVVDVTNFQAEGVAAAEQLFGAATRNLLAAEERARVRHHVLLSIVGVDRIEGNAHYAGKRLQERLVAAGRVPYTILRATQFNEFAAMVVGWTRQGDVATVPPLLVQPVAAKDVAEALIELAAGPAQGRRIDLAGPEPQDLVDMARRTLMVIGESVRLVPSWRSGVLGAEAAGEALLPGPDTRIAPTTFDAWLRERGAAGA